MLTVLHISAWDNAGGSGRSAYKIHTGLKRLGVRSRMLVGFRTGDDPDVARVGSAWTRAADRVVGRAFDHAGLQYLCYPSSIGLLRHPWVAEAEIVQLYNTHGGYFSHTVLPALSRQRPVVWRLSDMWPFTGHCDYSYECERWRTGCGACPHLLAYPQLHWDTTALLWRTKAAIYARSRLTLVAPSKWIAGLAGQSPLLGRFPIHVIPNGVDVEVFRPRPKPAAREVFGIDPTHRVLLFSANGVLQPRKGGTYLREALRRLSPEETRDVTVVVAGAESDRLALETACRVRRIGRIGDDETMAELYSAADVFVLPALAENMANGLIEAMACGTPPVAFDVGGISDAVRHLDTGYLAAARDLDDLVGGLQRLLTYAELRRRMAVRCREVVEREYGLDLQARRFRDLYAETLAQRTAPPMVRA